MSFRPGQAKGPNVRSSSGGGGLPSTVAVVSNWSEFKTAFESGARYVIGIGVINVPDGATLAPSLTGRLRYTGEPIEIAGVFTITASAGITTLRLDAQCFLMQTSGCEINHVGPMILELKALGSVQTYSELVITGSVVLVNNLAGNIYVTDYTKIQQVTFEATSANVALTVQRNLDANGSFEYIALAKLQFSPSPVSGADAGPLIVQGVVSFGISHCRFSIENASSQGAGGAFKVDSAYFGGVGGLYGIGYDNGVIYAHIDPTFAGAAIPIRATLVAYASNGSPATALLDTTTTDDIATLSPTGREVLIYNAVGDTTLPATGKRTGPSTTAGDDGNTLTSKDYVDALLNSLWEPLPVGTDAICQVKAPFASNAMKVGPQNSGATYLAPTPTLEEGPDADTPEYRTARYAGPNDLEMSQFASQTQPFSLTGPAGFYGAIDAGSVPNLVWNETTKPTVPFAVFWPYAKFEMVVDDLTFVAPVFVRTLFLTRDTNVAGAPLYYERVILNGFTLSGNAIKSGWNATSLDHSNQLNLTSDDHTQYALMVGRSGSNFGGNLARYRIGYFDTIATSNRSVSSSSVLDATASLVRLGGAASYTTTLPSASAAGNQVNQRIHLSNESAFTQTIDVAAGTINVNGTPALTSFSILSGEQWLLYGNTGSVWYATKIGPDSTGGSVEFATTFDYVSTLVANAAFTVPTSGSWTGSMPTAVSPTMRVKVLVGMIRVAVAAGADNVTLRLVRFEGSSATQWVPGSGGETVIAEINVPVIAGTQYYKKAVAAVDIPVGGTEPVLFAYCSSLPAGSSMTDTRLGVVLEVV